MGAYERLLSGTGLVWDHYYFGEELAQAFSEVGIAAVIAPTLQDRNGPFMSRIDAEFEATAAITSPAWEARGIFSAVGPHATDSVSTPLWERAVAAALTLDIPIHVHCGQSFDELAATKNFPLEHLERIGVLGAQVSINFAHGILLAEHDLRRLDPRRHALTVCPSSQQLFFFPPKSLFGNSLACPGL